MNNLKLTAAFIPCEEGGYTAIIKEMRGVVSEGDTLEEAKENLLDALELMLQVEQDDFEKEFSNKDYISNDLLIAV